MNEMPAGTVMSGGVEWPSVEWPSQWQAWRQALRAGDFGVWDLDPAEDLVQYSPAWKARLGFPPSAESDRTAFWRCRVHPDDLLPMMAALQAHMGNPDSGDYHTSFRLRSNGSGYRRVISRGRVVCRDAAGRATRMVGTMVDATATPAVPGIGVPVMHDVELPAKQTFAPLHALLGVFDRDNTPPGARGSAPEGSDNALIARVSDLLDIAHKVSRSRA